jgi:hypothetical protein
MRLKCRLPIVSVEWPGEGKRAELAMVGVAQ